MDSLSTPERRIQTLPMPSTQPNISTSRDHQEVAHIRAIQGNFQPTTARLRQAAAQALARTHQSRMGRVISPMGPRTHNGTINPSVHPQFRSKAVCGLSCNHCESNLCDRGMRAILLGNTTIELFSTDIPPFGVALVDKDYFTKNCSCRIRDAACLGCGNVVGYHVTHPCEKCLEACNNGHFWMFLSEAVRPVERYEKNGTKVLRWSAISDSPNGGEAVVEQEAGQLCR